MKNLALLVIAAVTIPVGYAQQGNKTLVDDLAKHWTTSKDLSAAVANAMPEDAYAFKATEGEMSFGEQMNHIALANGAYCSGALGTKSPLTKGTDNTKATAVKNLETAYDYCIDGLKGLSDSDLQSTVSMHGNSASKFDLFWGAFTHSAHHRGQAEVYLRLKGITPPSYKF